MWLIVGQMPIKAGWRHGSLALWDFSRSNKHCIHLSTTKAIYFSCFVLQCPYFRSSRPELFCKKCCLRPATLLKKRLWHRVFPVNFAKFLRTYFFTEHRQWLLLAFAFIEISYSNTVCNISAAETWIWLVSFNGREWWSERLHFHMYFPHNNHLLH